MKRARRRRSLALATFSLLALAAELSGRSLTLRIDRALHVGPLAAPTTRYYPFLLAGLRILASIALAALAWRLLRAHVAVSAGERMLKAIGHGHRRSVPQLRIRVTPRLWLASFAAMSLWYLVLEDAERLSEGRWPVLAPWLHTYALPVFAVLAILLAGAWSAVSTWLADADDFAAATLATVHRILRGRTAQPVPYHRASDDHGPRRLFGLAFESRPPPLPA
jgi:hypothetical protein